MADQILELVLGPPGTGKTTEMLSRLQDLLESGIPPRKIAYCSFTVEGTNQGKERAREQFHFDDEDMPYFRTLHSLAFQLLGLTPLQVMGRNHYREFSDLMGLSFSGYYTDDITSQHDKYLFYQDLLRNNKQYALDTMENLDLDLLYAVRTAYKAYKESRELFDFTDMMEACIKNKFRVPVEVAIIDEAQDLTELQWRFVEAMFSKANKIIIAGDDDQAIYQWSGADVSHFLNLRPTEQAKILNQSHRLPIAVQKYANDISSRIVQRIPKAFNAKDEFGELHFETSYKDVAFNREDTYMILARNNVFLDPIELWLQQNGIVYERRGKSSILDDELSYIKEWEAFRKGKTQHLSVDLQLNIKEDARGDDPWYDAFDWSPQRIAYYRDYLARRGEKNPKIRLSTIHTVKGAQADHVILIPDMGMKTYKSYKKNPDVEERVWYVGATRAAKSLTIIAPTTNRHYPLGKEIIEWAQQKNGRE